MKLMQTTLYETQEIIIDADVSWEHLVVLQKGKNEAVVLLDGSVAFSVSIHAQMIRIVGDNVAIYDGQDIHFLTKDGTLLQRVSVGRFISNLFPVQDGVICTYSDEGVYGHSIGEARVVVAGIDGSCIQQLSFASAHALDYDILFARSKPFACISYNANKIIQFDRDFQTLKVIDCPFELGNVIAFTYAYPYFLFIEENRMNTLHDDGTFFELQGTFSFGIRGSAHRGLYMFIEITQNCVIGYTFNYVNSLIK